MSYEGAIVVGGINYGKRLPRGRHGIPRELVVANQRERLLSAATTVFAELGYASLTVHNVIDRAGVSRATFYKIFDDKLACVVAAQHHAFDELQQAIAESCSAHGDWPSRVAAGVDAAIDFARARPDDARLLLASSHALSEPQLAQEGLDVHDRLVELLRRSADRGADEPAAGLTERAAVGAAVSLVATHLIAGEVEALAALKDDLAQIILASHRTPNGDG